jgi:CPA1 family monovalent cation:H+ antiporter
MLSITTALSLFLLLIVSSIVFFVAKKVRLPYAVLLVVFGILIVQMVQLPFLQPTFGFLTQLVLTPELLFFIFLPMLLFESAFNMNMRRMIESGWSIILLAVVGLLVSTALIGGALYLLLPLVGLPIPLIVALLFGAIISSTDPVAVLALFKEYGAPKRLTLIFEGESLFNDGTAVALFLVLLAVMQNGFHGAETVLHGIGVFGMMVLLGIGFGILMATIFARGLRFTRSNEFVSITLLIVSAHIVFILSELINTHPIFGIHLHISPIIATTVSSLMLGNYARHTLSPRSDEYLAKSIEHLAFVANSLVFLLAGIFFATTAVDFKLLLGPILISVIVVAIARVISVYFVTVPLNRLKLEAPIPSGWQKLLAWGSLRGALAIIVVLLIPDDLRPAGWAYSFTPKELLLAMTIGCILATLFIKAPTIGPIIRKLGINTTTPFEAVRLSMLGLYYQLTEMAKAKEHKARGFILDEHYGRLVKDLKAQIGATKETQQALLAAHGLRLFERVLLHTALDVEIHYLKDLYSNGEVNETVYRRIKGRLNLQKEATERETGQTDITLYARRKQLFDWLIRFVQVRLSRGDERSELEDQYQYYRAQSIIARKVLKTMTQMQTQYGQPVFEVSAYARTVAIYTTHHKTAAESANRLWEGNKEELAALSRTLAEKTLQTSGFKAINFMQDRGFADEAVSDEIVHRY